MPRAKSDDAKTSAELEAEIKEMQEKIAAKKKSAKLAKQKEDREAEQAREYEENKFNREFVEQAKAVNMSDYKDDGRTVYEIIKHLIDHPQEPEVKPVREEGYEGMMGELMKGLEDALPEL